MSFCFSVLVNFKFYPAILTMSKRNFTGLSTKGTQNKKPRDSFKLEELKVKVSTDMTDFRNVNVALRSIHEHFY